MTRAERIADLLLAARRDGRPIQDPPDELRPQSMEEAYAAQAAAAGRLGPIAGWKVGARAPDAEPTCAPLLEPLVFTDGARLDRGRFRVVGIEAELAVRFARPLPPRVTDYAPGEVLEAVGTLHPAIEIVDSRFAAWPDVPPLWQLADNQSHGAFVLGPGIADLGRLDGAEHAVRVEVDGAPAVDGAGRNPGGAPLRLLVWLANRLRHGRGLLAGDLVTTGSFVGIVRADSAGTVSILFPRAGGVGFTFAPD